MARPRAETKINLVLYFVYIKKCDKLLKYIILPSYKKWSFDNCLSDTEILELTF